MPGTATIAWVNGTPPPPYVQFKVFNSSTDATSFSVTFDTAPTNGNLLMLIASSGSTLNTPTTGGTWNADESLVNDLQTTIYSRVSNGTETTISITTSSGAGTGQLVAIEWPGYSAVDQTNHTGNFFNPTTSTNFPTLNTAFASEVIIAVGALNLANGNGNASPTVSWSNGFTELAFNGAKNGGSSAPWAIMLAVAYKVVTSTGAYTTTWSFTDDAATLGVNNHFITSYH